MRVTQSYYYAHKNLFANRELIDSFAKNHYNFHKNIAAAVFKSEVSRDGIKDLIKTYDKANYKPTKYIIRLVTDAKVSNHKFAICDINKNPLYCGTFLCSNNQIGDQLWGENEVLVYAIQEVGKMLKHKHIAYNSCTLVCYSDNLSLIDMINGNVQAANYVKHRLSKTLDKFPVQLMGFHIRGEDNFADGYTYLESECIDSDYMSWWKLVEKWI